MAIVIRLKRIGRLNRPSYRISVADSRYPLEGRTIEDLGFYDPLARQAERAHVVDVERARHWIAKGARITPTVWTLFKRLGVPEAYKPRPARDREGRKAISKTHARRESSSKARLAAKNQRRVERKKLQRAAKKAKKAAGAEAKA